MWIFTKHGFLSAVCARQGDGKHGRPVDIDRIMVRARGQSHLEALKKRSADLLGECQIQEPAGTDYTYRLVCAEVQDMQTPEVCTRGNSTGGEPHAVFHSFQRRTTDWDSSPASHRR
jgi:hypothetical protein